MNKIAVTLLVVTFLTISSVSQATNGTYQARCTLTESTAPAVRGLRLGMTTQELLAVFPNTVRKSELKDTIERAKSPAGTEATFLSFDPATDGDARQFNGVYSISAGLYKARLVDLNLQYSGASWKNIDEWIGTLSETFKLPGARDWAVGTDESPSKVLTCQGVTIEAAIQGGSSSFRIRNNSYQKEVNEHAKTAEEQRRKEVKP